MKQCHKHEINVGLDFEGRKLCLRCGWCISVGKAEIRKSNFDHNQRAKVQNW
jgi:hypothetical protein